MNLKFKYGKETLDFTVPDTNYSETLNPRHADGVDDSTAEVRRALANPIGSSRLKNLVSSTDQIVILVSDISRPTPSHVLLPPLMDELNAAGVPDKNICIIFGLGTHRKQSSKEMVKLVGQEIFNRIECIDHDIDDCEKIGVTSQGTSVSVFRRVLNADFIIATGNLEFHYFAGVCGGAKALAPGVCDWETIRSNHEKFLLDGAVSGKIVGNPVREEIDEIGQMVGIHFMLNAVLNSQKEIVRVFAGDIEKAHREGSRFLHSIFTCEIKELADIVIISPGGFPKDINLYQAHKAVENILLAVKPGGIIILVAQCGEGIGSVNFTNGMIGGASPQELIDSLNHDFVLGLHKAIRIAQIHLKTPFYMVSDLSSDIKEKMFIENFNTVDDALKQALKIQGKKARVLAIPFGASTLPYFMG